MLQYRLPTLSDETVLMDYAREHRENGENGLSASHGMSVMPFPEWIEKIRAAAETGEGGWGRYLVLLCLDGDRLVGLLSVRYELSAELSAKYGDIGYGVRPSERGKGYATEMMRCALSVCREKGLHKVTAGCYKDNLPSAAVIRKCGGILTAENDLYHEGRISQYYTVPLD